ETLHELLRLAGGFEAGPAVAGGFGGLERTLLPLLLAHRLKLFRLSLRERHHLPAPDSTLLINLREADYRDGWNSASTSPQQVRAAIAVELSRTLALRVRDKESWDQVFRDEPWYGQGVILAGAATAGAIDAWDGVRQAAALTIELIGAG